MPVNSNRDAVEARMRQAEADALIAAGNVYRNAMTEALQGGYTSGAFYSGMQGIAGSVSVSEPQRDPEGAYIVVGTNVEYAKYWELGFNRRLWVWFDEKRQQWFSRPGPTVYERVEKWRPTLESKAAEIIAKYASVYGKLMQ
jgi:hypothetical protein